MNWDVLPYMACILAFDGVGDEEAHRQVYRAAEEAVSKRTYTALTTHGKFRTTTARDPAALAAQRPFYQGRIGSIMPAWALYRAGFPLASAPVVVSIVSWWLTSFIVLLWLWHRLPPPLAAAAIPLSLSTPFVAPATTASSDATFQLLLFAAMVALLEIRGRRLARGVFFALMLLSLLVRVDAVVFLAPFALWMAWGSRTEGRTGWGPWLLFLVALAVLVPLHGWFFEARPWAVNFQFGVGVRPDVDSIPTHLSWSDWWNAIERVIDGRWSSSILSLGAMALLVGAALLRSPPVGRQRWATAGLLMSAAGCLSVRFLLLPRDWDRLIGPYWAAIVVLTIIAVWTHLRPVAASSVVPE